MDSNSTFPDLPSIEDPLRARLVTLLSPLTDFIRTPGPAWWVSMDHGTLCSVTAAGYDDVNCHARREVLSKGIPRSPSTGSVERLFCLPFPRCSGRARSPPGTAAPSAARALPAARPGARATPGCAPRSSAARARALLPTVKRQPSEFIVTTRKLAFLPPC